jgi:protein-arginine kinase activator protein McsA
MSDQIFKMTKVYKDIKPTKDNLSDLNKIQIEMGKAAKSRDDIKALIVKDQESEIKIQGAGSEDFSMWESELNLRGES